MNAQGATLRLLSERALGKWKGGSHSWNCWRPGLAQKKTEAPDAAWAGEQGCLQPLPQHKPELSQEEFKGSKPILEKQGFGQR